MKKTFVDLFLVCNQVDAFYLDKTTYWNARMKMTNHNSKTAIAYVEIEEY